MAFAWAEYHSVAQFIQSQTVAGISHEALMRCAISRAYYAAFCHARNYARDRHGLMPRYNGDDHSLVRRHFRTRRERGVATKLDNLRDWRNVCDYEDNIPDLTKWLPIALAEAQMVIAILK